MLTNQMIQVSRQNHGWFYNGAALGNRIIALIALNPHSRHTKGGILHSNPANHLSTSWLNR